jgi:transposase
MKLVEETIRSIPVPRPAPTAESPQHMCMDKGYDYEAVRDLVAAFGYTAHIKARGEEAQAIKTEAGFRARRWVVERTHGWLNRFRKILIRWERKTENYEALLHLAFASIVFAATERFWILWLKN